MNKSKIIYVAMSGGVDSSMSAALLKQEGFNVVGVFMKFFSPANGACLWKKERQDALRVAAKLNIPLLTWDFSSQYEKLIVRYLINSYRAGLTPNPDIRCNKIIKFELFFKRALKEGADYIATGHYGQIKKDKRGGDYQLVRAIDKNKDQTYFLYTLKQTHLAKIIFPVGCYQKSEVRALARKWGLPVAQKKDSQGVCFIGPIKMSQFLRTYLKINPGRIVDMKNRFIARHQGTYFYTIGQRHNLGINCHGGPYFVIKKDLEKNLVIVGSKKDLLKKQAKVSQFEWVGMTPQFPITCKARIRHQGKLVKTKVKKNGNLEFSEPMSAIASGQSAVLYQGEIVLGGAIFI